MSLYFKEIYEDDESLEKAPTIMSAINNFFLIIVIIIIIVLSSIVINTGRPPKGH
jgi:hypothetical protein